MIEVRHEKHSLHSADSPPQKIICCRHNQEKDMRHMHIIHRGVIYFCKNDLTAMISARISPRWLSTCNIRVLVLLSLLLSSQETFGFAPTNCLRAVKSQEILLASPSSLESPTETSTSAWIQQEIESHIKGEEVIDSQCVVGPKHVLIYDTTLRGTSVFHRRHAMNLISIIPFNFSRTT
jgi:hypothetical protein